MWELVSANRRKAAVLVVSMAALLAALGWVLGEASAPGAGGLGLSAAALVWIALSLTAYFGGDSIALALAGARKLERSDHPVLFNVVEEMVIASQLGAMPEVYLMDEESPNAFATGRSPEKSAVAVTSGLLKTLTRDELQGVIAHEIGHLKNRDSLYLMMASVMMGAVVLLADAGWRGLRAPRRSRTSQRSGGGQVELALLVAALVLLILAPILARLLYLAISRSREHLADASAAVFTRYPEGLAAALEKIGKVGTPIAAATRATAPLYLVNPLKAAAQGLADLSSTHPPISERVAILRALGKSPNLAGYDAAFRKVTGRPVGVVPLSALREPEPAAPAKPAARPDIAAAVAQDLGEIDRARMATDALWKLSDYAFIACACSTKLKIPPKLRGREISCPQCGATHSV